MPPRHLSIIGTHIDTYTNAMDEKNTFVCKSKQHPSMDTQHVFVEPFVILCFVFFHLLVPRATCPQSFAEPSCRFRMGRGEGDKLTTWQRRMSPITKQELWFSRERICSRRKWRSFWLGLWLVRWISMYCPVQRALCCTARERDTINIEERSTWGLSLQ